MDWLALALGLVQLANWLLNYAKSKSDFNVGQDAQILAASKLLMAQSAEGKKIVERVAGLSGSALDDMLAGLEDKPGG